MLRQLGLLLFSLSLVACASTPDPITSPTDEVDTANLVNGTAWPGTPLPLICSKAILATDALADRPNAQIMWENYLPWQPLEVFDYIGGKVAVNGNLPYGEGRWENACTVRLSYMLNKAGHDIAFERRKTVSGGDGRKYYYRVKDIEDYFIKIYGTPDVAIEDGTGNAYDLPDVPGIVLMDFPDNSFTGHVTIWNGRQTVDLVNIGGYRVLFWKLPCFLPEGRKSLDQPVVSLGYKYFRG